MWKSATAYSAYCVAELGGSAVRVKALRQIAAGGRRARAVRLREREQRGDVGALAKRLEVVRVGRELLRGVRLVGLVGVAFGRAAVGIGGHGFSL